MSTLAYNCGYQGCRDKEGLLVLLLEQCDLSENDEDVSMWRDQLTTCREALPDFDAGNIEA